MCPEVITLIILLLSFIAAAYSAFFSHKNIKALYALRKSEIDLALREERRGYFNDAASYFRPFMSGGIHNYMIRREYNYQAPINEILQLQQKANYSLDKQSKEVFSEVIKYLINVFEQYGEGIANHQEKGGDPILYNHPRIVGTPDYNKAWKRLDDLESKYLCVESIYPKE